MPCLLPGSARSQGTCEEPPLDGSDCNQSCRVQVLFFSVFSRPELIGFSLSLSVEQEVYKLSQGRCDILVATPARLVQLLEVQRFQTLLNSLSAVVCDDADRFHSGKRFPMLIKIRDLLPDRAVVPRQTLVLTATTNNQVKQVCTQFLMRD